MVVGKNVRITERFFDNHYNIYRFSIFRERVCF